jgi:hypothetical protein
MSHGRPAAIGGNQARPFPRLKTTSSLRAPTDARAPSGRSSFEGGRPRKARLENAEANPRAAKGLCPPSRVG